MKVEELYNLRQRCVKVNASLMRIPEVKKLID